MSHVSQLDSHEDMTEIGLVKTMTISYFKSHLSEVLRRVRKGARIVISDRETPVAEVVPFETDPARLRVRQPGLMPFAAPKTTFKIDHDPLEYLMEERQAR
jgi:prevent-host-death family protein